MAGEKVTTQTASAVVPPATRAEPPVDPAESVAITEPPVDPAGPPAAGGESREQGRSLDAEQMAARDREAAQFRSKAKARPGRPAAVRAGGYVLTKDGWVLDRKVTGAKPGEPDVVFRKGEGSTVRNAGGWRVGDD